MVIRQIAYKGFDKDLNCEDFQYEIGKEYEEKEVSASSKKGFHACENHFKNQKNSYEKKYFH